MARADRVKFIKRIEKARNTRVISYVTSTRPGIEVQMSMDIVRYVYEHLEAIKANHTQGGKPDIDLFIHSNGGDGTVPWKLVTLIREYTDKFSVLVPFRAFSAATLTALGANEVVMHPMGMLGPTDPTVTNGFNPTDPGGKKLGISVEDVTAYIQLIKEDVGIRHEDELVQAFNVLANNIHPLALGNVKRSLSQSRMMAAKLLGLHMDHVSNEHAIDDIVDSLTSKLFYHGHPINRNEARKQVGLTTVINAPGEVESDMWNLYLQYEKEMKLIDPFDITQEFFINSTGIAPGTHVVTPLSIARLAYVESSKHADANNLEYHLEGQRQPTGGATITMVTDKKGWIRE